MAMDPVNKKAVKKDFENRKDKDIDNDGDVDSSDEYLHKRRKAVSKAIKNTKKNVDESSTVSPRGSKKATSYDSYEDYVRNAKKSGVQVIPKKLWTDLKNESLDEEVELDEAKKDHFVYQRGVPKTKEVVHRGTKQSSKDWIEKNAKFYGHKGKNFDIYKGKYPNVKPSDRLDYKYVAEESVDLDEAIDPREYTTGSEKSQFGGYRAKITNKRKGTTLYLGGTSYKTQDDAKGEAEEYLKGYRLNDKTATRMANDYRSKNKDRVFKESVELDEGAKEKALKKLMTRALNGKKAKPGYTSATAENGDFVVHDGGGRIVGRLKSGEYGFNEEWKKDSGWKKPGVHKDKYGNTIKTKNIAKSLAKRAAKKSNTTDEK